MTDLIDRNMMIDALKNMYQAAEKCGQKSNTDITIKARAELCMASLAEMMLRIEDLPSAQPEQKTGKWIKEDRGGVEYTAVCNKCGYATFWSDAEVFIYCPICGKKMEEIK